MNLNVNLRIDLIFFYYYRLINKRIAQPAYKHAGGKLHNVWYMVVPTPYFVYKLFLRELSFATYLNFSCVYPGRK